jgi:hypothetical protein
MQRDDKALVEEREYDEAKERLDASLTVRTEQNRSRT